MILPLYQPERMGGDIMLEDEELFGYEDDDEIIETAKRKLAEKLRMKSCLNY